MVHFLLELNIGHLKIHNIVLIFETVFSKYFS